MSNINPDLQLSLRKCLETNRHNGISLLQKLVQAASTQGNEKEAQNIIIHTLSEMGLIVDIWEPDGEELVTHSNFSSSRKMFKDSPNVVGVLKGTGSGRSLILNGHIDVVPAGDHKQWSDDPYSGKIVDGKMFGRGVTDMKGGNVALLLAIKAIQSLGIRLKGDVIFQSVIEEESGGVGTLAAILRGYKADAAIIPEPTNMKIFPKQQGSLWFRIVVRGRAAHGGTRYEGVSAIEKASSVIDHIRNLEVKRNERITDSLYKNIPIPIPINIGKIEGGNWPSSVPDLVTIEGRMGVSPEETITEAKHEMEEWIKKLIKIDSWFEKQPPSLEWFGARWLPGAINVDHEIMHILASSYRLVLNEDPIVEASPWGTDGGLLTDVGGIPTIIFGPGITKMAHYPNEYIEIKSHI